MPMTQLMRDLLGQLIIGAATSQVFNNSLAQVHVGDSTMTFDPTKNAMGSSGANFAQSSMDASFPDISTSSGGPPAMRFRATFDTSKGNFNWKEWGVKNTSGSGTATSSGILMNRSVTDLGTKTGAQTWQFTGVITPATST